MLYSMEGTEKPCGSVASGGGTGRTLHPDAMVGATVAVAESAP